MEVIDEFNIRTAGLLGVDGVKRLNSARVLVVGLGGVGGYAFEALVRAGIGTVGVCDGDVISPSNFNRQILATDKTLGLKKTEAAKSRALSVNPKITLNVYDFFYSADTAGKIPLKNYDYIVDAIDDINGKVLLVINAEEAGVNIISSMGAGNKLSPEGFVITDIYSTKNCPLSKKMRGILRKRGIPSLYAVYSPEPPAPLKDGFNKLSSVSFVPPVAGMLLASKVIKDIAGNYR
jgi:tRNA A37 threonylcarbamoyladenosine dehydratase